MRSFPYRSVMGLTVLAVTACEKPSPKAATGVPDFHNPADPGFAQQAPDSFRARFSTTQGDVVILVHRTWAPHGVDRFYNLVRAGYYDDNRFFRIRTDRCPGGEDLIRKCAPDRAASVQKLRHLDDVAGEEKQSLVDIKGFSGRRDFRLLHMNANEVLNAPLGIGL